MRAQVLLIVLACAAGSAAGAPPGSWIERPGLHEFSGRLIVKVRGGLDPAREARARARLVGATRVLATDEYIVPVSISRVPGEGERRLGASLAQTGDYAYVEPDWLVYPTSEPNDPLLGSQWHLTTIGAREAWSTAVGSPGIVYAIVDSGVDLAHPDLAAALVPGYNSVDRRAQAEGGLVSDMSGHGTRVAGVGGAIGNNAVGVSGVAWDVGLMPIRTSNNAAGSAFMTDILDGARWAADRGARVVNASFSGVSNASIETTGAYMRERGSLFVFSAGNDSANLAGLDYPSVIVVGATDQDDRLASFSAFGDLVDVVAPGVSIFSTTLGGGYGPESGTSFAAPCVAGALAVIWSVDPAFTPAQVEQFLVQGCDDLGRPGRDPTFARGRINLARSVELAQWGRTERPVQANDDWVRAFAAEPILIDVLDNDWDPNGDDFVLDEFEGQSEAGATITRSVGTGPGGRDRLLYSAPAGSSGEDRFTYWVLDADGGRARATVHVRRADPSVFRPSDNPQAVRSFIDTAFYALEAPTRLPAFEQLTPYRLGQLASVNQNETSGSPLGAQRADNVGAVISGYLNIPDDDVYTIALVSDEGSRLWIGDQLVVDNDGLHPMREASGEIGLRRGNHRLRIEYFEATGTAGLRAFAEGWRRPRAIIPNGWYRRPCVADFDRDGFVDFLDWSAFQEEFERLRIWADVNRDGVVDTRDQSAFLTAFQSGC